MSAPEYLQLSQSDRPPVAHAADEKSAAADADSHAIAVVPAGPPASASATATPSSSAPASASASPPGDVVSCRICGSDEDGHLLISPCDCSGSLARVHTTCLQMWISTRPQRSAMAAQAGQVNGPNAAAAAVRALGVAGPADDTKMICEICHAEYRLNVWRRLPALSLSARSLSHTCGPSTLTFPPPIVHADGAYRFGMSFHFRGSGASVASRWVTCSKWWYCW
jgi:hypothetical protein